ncbi:MAG: peptide deformylase [Acidobacteria bacterium]|nr:peptide deformylase [Acidobacteriota bacterium]
MLMTIRKYGDPVLRRKAEAVTVFDAGLAKLADDMAETMYAAPGIGLAAPQVGVGKRLITVDVTHDNAPDHLHTLVNPHVLEASLETDRQDEGCLSVPDFFEPVVRPLRIRVAFHDLQGNERAMDAEGLLARCILHEIDHLEGVLFVDRLAGFRRKLVQGRLKRSFGALSPLEATV